MFNNEHPSKQLYRNIYISGYKFKMFKFTLYKQARGDAGKEKLPERKKP